MHRQIRKPLIHFSHIYLFEDKTMKIHFEKEIRDFLLTGDSNPWGGGDHPDGMSKGLNEYHDALRDALLKEVKKRSQGVKCKRMPSGLDSESFVREKVRPMVEGLFPRKEWDVVLDLLANRIVFLTRENTYRAIMELPFLHSAWNVVNVFLTNIGIPALSGDESYAVGIAEGDHCFVSMTYFEDDGRFSDYLVHEAAHIFHYTKRKTVELPYTRRREWLLQIDFQKREIFAYACELYSQIRKVSKNMSEQKTLLKEYKSTGIFPPEDHVDRSEYLETLDKAISARNGWKRILSRCEIPPTNKRNLNRTSICQVEAK